jgi:heme A synthase
VVAGLAPLFYGLAAMLDGRLLVEISGTLSRASFTMTPELNYVRKPLGIYVAMFGALLLYAATDPVRHRAVITWGALLLLGRGVQRLLITGELHEVFGIPMGLNVLHCAYLIALAVTLLVLRPRRAQPPGGGAGRVPAPALD